MIREKLVAPCLIILETIWSLTAQNQKKLDNFLSFSSYLYAFGSISLCRHLFMEVTFLEWSEQRSLFRGKTLPPNSLFSSSLVLEYRVKGQDPLQFQRHVRSCKPHRIPCIAPFPSPLTILSKRAVTTPHTGGVNVQLSHSEHPGLILPITWELHHTAQNLLWTHIWSFQKTLYFHSVSFNSVMLLPSKSMNKEVCFSLTSTRLPPIDIYKFLQ